MSEETKAIRIRRAAHDKENPYYLASRATAQNKVLSYEALGMLHYILSKPDDWQVQPSDLEREKCKRNQVYKILNQLIEARYIERVYHRDKLGRVEWVEYIAHEIAQPLPENQEMDMQEVDYPQMEKQHITEYREDSIQKENKKESSTRTPSPSKGNAKANYTRADALINAWAEAQGYEGAAIGATFTSAANRKKALEMLGWEQPVTPEEVRQTVILKRQTGKDYAFAFLVSDIPILRAKHRLALPTPPTKVLDLSEWTADAWKGYSE